MIEAHTIQLSWATMTSYVHQRKLENGASFKS